MYRKIGELAKIKNTNEECLDDVMHKDYMAFVESQHFLNFYLDKYGPRSFFMPPQTEQSTFFMDFNAIAYSRSFLYIKQFDEV